MCVDKDSIRFDREVESFVDKAARPEVVEWLGKASAEDREAFCKLFRSFQQVSSSSPSTRGSALRMNAHQEHEMGESVQDRETKETSRPGTASVMPYSRRELERSVMRRAYATGGIGVLGTPETGGTRLLKPRLEGAKKMITVDETFAQEARMLELKKALIDRYVFAKSFHPRSYKFKLSTISIPSFPLLSCNSFSNFHPIFKFTFTPNYFIQFIANAG